MTSYNDITGDAIKTGGASNAYRDGWERIFGKNKDAPDNPEKDNESDKVEQDVNEDNTQ